MTGLSYVSDQPVEWLPFDLIPSLAPISWDQNERVDVLNVASMFKWSLRKQLQARQTPETICSESPEGLVFLMIFACSIHS